MSLLLPKPGNDYKRAVGNTRNLILLKTWP